MSKVSVYDMAGNQVSETELSDAVFGIEPNQAVMHASVVNYLANQRQGTQSTLTRTEVRGGGKKPWRQKGTGHARQGSIRAPQWVHGGIALGPKPRDYSYSLNKKVKRLAMKSALSSKVKEENIIVLDALNMDGFKTKTIVNMLNALGVKGKALIVTDGADKMAAKSAANIPGVKTAAVMTQKVTGVDDNGNDRETEIINSTLNVYDILNHDKLIIVKSAVAKLEEVYA